MLSEYVSSSIHIMSKTWVRLGKKNFSFFWDFSKDIFYPNKSCQIFFLSLISVRFSSEIAEEQGR